MDLTMLRLKKKVRKTIGFKVDRPNSHRVWEAYQPQTTDAYIHFEFYKLPSSLRRVREMFDVGGRLENASGRQTPLGAWWVSNLGSVLWKNKCSARMKRLWPM
ncbi:hypothetical protein TNCV_4371151 [Trichonephila clavipes]|nr:hypothetical protein TNCV_4371151 [Trichonephila clavipes]